MIDKLRSYPFGEKVVVWCIMAGPQPRLYIKKDENAKYTYHYGPLFGSDTESDAFLDGVPAENIVYDKIWGIILVIIVAMVIIFNIYCCVKCIKLSPKS